MYLVTLIKTVFAEGGNEDNVEVYNFHTDFEQDAYEFMEKIVNGLGMESPEDNNSWVVYHGDAKFTLDFHYLTSVENFDDMEGFLGGLMSSSPFNQDKAFDEGWCIAECTGSSYIPEGWLEIQKLDEAGIFYSDREAQAWVTSLAAKNSEYHKNAINYMEGINYASVRMLQKETRDK